MKKFNIFKIVQLSLLILITLISVYLLMQPEVKQYIFASTPATILFIIIWIILLASYVFLLIDFSILSSVKLNYHNLYGVAYSDPLSGIPNRFSCDTIIEKYYDTTLYDHATGNMLLKDFSNILSASALSLCFVGRNGGNKFLAIFENCTDDQLNTFLARIADRVKQHNQSPSAISIEYRIGIAKNSEEHLAEITQLIALAYNRISDETIAH